ncbi:MYND finger [Diaporthe helianthi]|uniref:MYND finger n=1 Tax=Diaporthe helianthi TaxID=158607 RepID=A0A2P5HXS7_DIAHE|nr:MYND finger [Diaporthe helianthi]
MLTPTVLRVVRPFCAVGSAPAVSLTQCVPQGVDADILLLGCGDVRDILYTAYHEKGFPPRRLDITSCDVEDAIVARNVLFLSLLVAQREQVKPQLFWNLYYHLLLDEESAQLLEEHLAALLNASTTLKTWRESEFSGRFRFVNASTLSSVRQIWHAYAECLRNKDQGQYRSDFEIAIKYSNSYRDDLFASNESVAESIRAASPLGIEVSEEIRAALNSWWERGSTGQVSANTNIPNPLFAATLSRHSVLAPSENPILSYHLARASIDLQKTSVRKSGNMDDNLSELAFVAAAQDQFAEWSREFVDMASRGLILRFITADALSLCHALQHHLETCQLSGNFYRSQLTMEHLELNHDEYGPQSTAPKQFDVIDTSDLAESLGALNMLIAGTPLLKPNPWATLYTKVNQGGTEGENAKFDELLCGQTRTIATLLGISPVEYWTNSTAISNVDDYRLGMSAMQSKSDRQNVQWRFAWKSLKHLSGRVGPLPPLKVNEDALGDLINKVYRAMLAGEDMAGFDRTEQDAHPKFHPVAFVAFIRRLLQTVGANKKEVCRKVLAEILQDSSSKFAPRYSEAVSLEMARHGFFTLPSATQNTLRASTDTQFPGWPHVPESVAITISIPAEYWKKFSQVALVDKLAFTVEGGLRLIQGDEILWHHVFPDVQVTFGTVSTWGDRQHEGFAVAVDEDHASWSGGSDLVASFSVPSKILQVDPSNTKVSLSLHNGVSEVLLSNKKLRLWNPTSGEPMNIFETDLDDTGHVYITKNQPGLVDFPLYSSLRPTAVPEIKQDCRPSFSAEIDGSGGITTITGRLEISAPQGKKLLSEKATVDVRKISPFVFEIVLGEREATYQLCFPVPVVKDGSTTRIARTSAYVEVVAPLADPATSQTLDDFIFLCILADSGLSSGLDQTIPVPLNIPHINLDTLPVLDVTDKSRVAFLTTLTSFTFSARERKLREQADSSGLATSARMNFKESIFTIFMLAAGLQGGQTGLFAIHHPEKGGVHMLLFVSAFRMDGANGTVVLDAAVIPFTVDLINSGRLESFLLILRELDACTVTVNDEELVLWKKVLPALAERCRTWNHAAECEYARPGATVPLSTEIGKQVLCSCGAGRLPEDFLSLPEWEVASQFATRIAISPTYAVPFVEDIIDDSMVGASSGLGMNVQGDETLRCRNCGDMEAKDGGPLKKCMRCLKVRYCSAECQKKDWKKHRMECGEGRVM